MNGSGNGGNALQRQERNNVEHARSTTEAQPVCPTILGSYLPLGNRKRSLAQLVHVLRSAWPWLGPHLALFIVQGCNSDLQIRIWFRHL